MLLWTRHWPKSAAGASEIHLGFQHSGSGGDQSSRTGVTAIGRRSRRSYFGFIVVHSRGGRARPPGNLRELAVETRMNSASIFDLSPSEKLQLVEDLWDDLAAAPETVPVHDWQKQELARRKANLLKNPASGLPWEEVKRKVRARYAR